MFEYETGMDTRIGYPNEHLSSNTNIKVTSPLFATGVGLVVKGFEKYDVLNATNSSMKTRDTNKGRTSVFFKKIKEFFDDSVE